MVRSEFWVSSRNLLVNGPGEQVDLCEVKVDLQWTEQGRRAGRITSRGRYRPRSKWWCVHLHLDVVVCGRHLELVILVDAINPWSSYIPL